MELVRHKYTRQLSSGIFNPAIPIVAKHPLGWMDPNKVASPTDLKATTILCVRKGNKVVMIGDGQVSLGSTVVKPNAKKVRRLKDNIIAGFAGATADAFTLLERLEMKLEEYPGQLLRSCVELAKSWRTDKYLRTLEAIICVADKEISLTLTGNGDVLEPNDGLIGIGSGGLYALSAAKGLISVDGLTAEEVATRSMKIASDICVYTNSNFTVEVLDL
eukprot:TRINITY_DN13153_c0_g1_i1.p1 TRINITY_DN13153_c0_g1~~TRINITY_DN13153_c0_g1_i1.p1  ORF type:complete len:246 (+),score=69.57 TRINITY_DN13153_c0_g1_i1:85-738(+)